MSREILRHQDAWRTAVAAAPWDESIFASAPFRRRRCRFEASIERQATAMRASDASDAFRKRKHFSRITISRISRSCLHYESTPRFKIPDAPRVIDARLLRYCAVILPPLRQQISIAQRGKLFRARPAPQDSRSFVAKYRAIELRQ